MPFKENLFGFNILCMELLTSAYYMMLVFPVLFPHSTSNDDIGQHCIKIVTAAIFCNVGFSTLITFKKLFLFIKARIIKKTTKVHELQITTQTHPVLKIDSIIE